MFLSLYHIWRDNASCFLMHILWLAFTTSKPKVKVINNQHEKSKMADGCSIKNHTTEILNIFNSVRINKR